MSGVAALDDIHGNLPALDAVLAEPRREPLDAVVVGGDIAAGPMPHEVLGRLRELPWRVHCLRGNADRAVVMGFDGTIPPSCARAPRPAHGGSLRRRARASSSAGTPTVSSIAAPAAGG